MDANSCTLLLDVMPRFASTSHIQPFHRDRRVLRHLLCKDLVSLIPYYSTIALHTFNECTSFLGARQYATLPLLLSEQLTRNVSAPIFCRLVEACCG